VNILLAPVGSHGDVHPFCGIGAEMLRRGHRVTMFTNGAFEPLARRVGLDFVPVGTAEQFAQIVSDPDLWHPTKGWQKVFNSIAELTPLQYDAMKALVTPGDTVMVGATLAFGARVLQEQLAAPMASVHLQPSIMRSAHETPKLPGMAAIQKAPRWLKRLTFAFADKFVLDRYIGGPLNAFRAGKGLPPVKHITSEWWHSPDLVIGLFPEWFAAPQPDWPRQMKLTGFPLFDEKGLEPLPPDLQRFLESGDKPIAFTPGSAMFHGHDFFEAAADACRILCRRGILLTRHAEHVPARLPQGVIHVKYAPFSELLPRCAALVHHGGIGTTAQALAAGVPQLIQPMSHDQPDNAERVRRLGVGAELPVKQFRGGRVAETLRRLIESADVAAKCREVAQRFVDARPLEETCDLIERLAPNDLPSRRTGSGRTISSP
jgi:UDP:flavonoid glycosyltransferase YjiC (YdhE family)